MLKICSAPLLGVLLLAVAPAYAESDAEMEAIKQEIRTLRESYETRIRQLEQRLDRAEAGTQQNSDAVSTSNAGTVGQVDKSFNPALSVVLQGKLNSYSEDPDSYRLPGFQLGEEAGLAPDGLTLDETEITASANVDHLFYAQTTVSFNDNGGSPEASVEEAYADTLALPAGLGLRFGRFYSGIGYLNKFHSHAWDFHDEPLVYRAFLGKQFGDDGLRLTWLAPTDLLLQFGTELFTGKSFPAANGKRDLGDSRSLFVKLGGDLGASHAWQAGLAGLWSRPHRRDSSLDGFDTRFTGDSRLLIADFVWKWAPNGNPVQRNLKLQAEVFHRSEQGRLLVNDTLNQALLHYDGTQWGGYAQVVYQFMPHWRVGSRYDRLLADNKLSIGSLGGFSNAATVRNGSGFEDDNHPRRWSAMLDWSASEFSRLRLQYNRDNSRAANTDNQWTLQYIMSLGSHGAHEF